MFLYIIISDNITKASIAKLTDNLWTDNYFRMFRLRLHSLNIEALHCKADLNGPLCMVDFQINQNFASSDCTFSKTGLNLSQPIELL